MDLARFIASSQRPIILDGGMGTELARRGAEMGGQASVRYPQTVSAVHRSYAELGVDLIITNTLTMNRVFVESYRIGVDVREVNLAGARLAKEAAGEGQYVLGDVSSTGKLLKPNGPLSEEEAYRAFVEQAGILAEGGVDGLIIETMSDLKECLTALRACKTTGLPVIACMTFETTRNGGRTYMGNSARDCARALAAESPMALGANCGSITPAEMAEIIATMREETSLPLIAEPNAGSPRFVEGKAIFDMSPQDFATGTLKCVEAGATLVGGCCGTGPEHIRALIQTLRKNKT